MSYGLLESLNLLFQKVIHSIDSLFSYLSVMDMNDETTVRSFIAEGIVGAVLGAIILGNGRKRSSIGALAGAVILATYKAFEQAQKTNIGVCIKEDNKLFEILPGGNKRFIKNIPKPNVPASNSFKLK